MEKNFLTIDTSESTNLKFSEIFDTLLIIPLEESERSFVGRVSKVITSSHYIFVLDKSIAESLFIFDYEGHIINSFRGTGSGPGEYIRVSNFFLSYDEKSVFIKDNSLGKLLEFDLDGEIIRDVSFPEGIGYFDLYPFEDGFYAVQPNQNGIGVHIEILDKALIPTGEQIPILENKIRIEAEYKDKYFYEGANGDVIFKSLVSNTLNFISLNGSSSFIEFSFDKNQFSTYDIPWNKSKDAIHQDNLNLEIWNNNYYAFSDEIIDLENYTLINVWHGKSWKIIVFDKTLNEAKFIDKLENDMDGLIANIPGVFPANSNANQFVIDMSPDDLLSLSSILENSNKYSDRIREVEKEIIENPILFLYKKKTY